MEIDASNSPSFNWEPVCQGLVGEDLETTLKTAENLKADKVPTAELPLMLSALLPAVSTVLTSKAEPASDINSIHHKIRACLLKWMAALPTNEAVHPHAPHLVAVAMDVLNRDYEDNAISASRILFNLFKTYRSLPPDVVQPYLDFVVSLYGGVPSAIERNFATVVPGATLTDTSESSKTPGVFPVSSLPSSRPQFKSISSFRVLTECPLVVIFIIQLYPSYVESSSTIPGLIKVMMEALSQRPPTLQSLVSDADSTTKRLYLSTVRDLVAAQAKTLSFLIYLLRTFTKELKPYENQLATNVVALIRTCPRESIGTRRELLVATRHLLNSEFRNGFFHHVDSFLDERVLTGNRSVVRPMAYQMLSDLIHHVRGLLSMKQMTRIVGMYCRILHDNSLPISSQNAAVRTLLHLIETIFKNSDPDGQLGRDMLVRLLFAFVEKLESIKQRSHRDTLDDTIRDIPALIRIIVVGLKSIITFICGYRAKRFETMQQAVDRPTIKPGSNEEVSSATMKITATEASLIDRYCATAFPVMSLMCDKFGSHRSGEKPMAELHRDALTYFAAAFTAMDGYNLRRTLGKRLDELVDAIINDASVLVIPRHLLGSNATTSLEFCGILLDHLVGRMHQLSTDTSDDMVFFDEEGDQVYSQGKNVDSILFIREQRPMQSAGFLEKRSATLLQLFERILKSLSSYPDNEVVIRKHLRFLVGTCLKLTMEKSGDEPDKYCMLLRYLFRLISAGKFEESYKELLPLIPAVLNGLYRIICSNEASALRNTAIELCLTIPARLSSLLPHMNLLIRVIIPALESDVGELVNLGLLTLEFWVDNLNPLFLYPELSKQIELFSNLMQALSRHLRPAPYPYGLPTLRLLGKLGGKNRQFLRFPMELSSKSEPTHVVHFESNWKVAGDNHHAIRLPLPIESCVRLLRQIFDRSHYDNLSASKMAHETLENDQTPQVVLSTLEDQVIACFRIVRKAKMCQGESQALSQNMFFGMLYCTVIDRLREEAFEELFSAIQSNQNVGNFATCLAAFMASSRSKVLGVGVDIITRITSTFGGDDREHMLDAVVNGLCDICCAKAGSGYDNPQHLILLLIKILGPRWSERHQFKIVNATLLPVKSVPRELTHISIKVTRKFMEVCLALFGEKYVVQAKGAILQDIGTLFSHKTDQAHLTNTINVPCDAVFRLIAKEVSSPHQLTRFAARFLLTTIASNSTEKLMYELAKKHKDLIRQVLFSKSLRFLPLPQQVGLLEGLFTMVSFFPQTISLEDQHLLACLSELLKMSSVADRDMEDSKLDGRTVDKDGFVTGPDVYKPTLHCFSIFFRRSCVIHLGDARFVIPQELPAPVQLRVSAVKLLHIVIKAHESTFFEAENTTAIGSLRPHVVSLFFRSLVSLPIGVVDAAHDALRDILAMNKSSGTDENQEDGKVQPRLPKELLQNCIRPVLQNLKDHTRLSVPLLRGLSRLLSLLSSWFNKTLGEKLLDHLAHWADPQRIMSRKIWKAGEEPVVAAAIVGIFALLPQSSLFVEHLVKTCINLEAKMGLYKAAKFVESPYRRPLALYLNKHPQHAVSFFFPRLKTPMYSELFQHIIGLPKESQELRRYLSNRQRIQSILNVCYERPLAILRSEKTLTAGTSTRNILALYGVKDGDLARIPDDQRPMDVEALELQQQGFRIIQVLIAMDPTYFEDHFEIVRAFRFLWKSRGRLVRVQYEDMVSPRFQEESKMLATFLISYASKAKDDIEILFELSRAFLQPSAADFNFVSKYLKDRMSNSSPKTRTEILGVFFDFMSKESTDELLKVLGTQHLIRPLLETHKLAGDERQRMIQNFMSAVLFKDGKPIQCGERLRVELLQIANILLQQYSDEMTPFANQLMKYCWSLLKSEDSIGKSWSFLVIARALACSDSSTKTTLQTYYSLLKSHQQEGKDLIRKALLILVPYLAKTLSHDEKIMCLKETNQMLHNDGNTSPQVAHVLKTVVDFPDFYKELKSNFAHSIFTVLPRLNFSQNSPPENKSLALETVTLLFDWYVGGEVYSVEQRSTVVNFVIQFRLAMAEVGSESKPKEQRSFEFLDSKFDDILRQTVSKWHPVLKQTHFEKLVSSDVKNSSPFIAAMKTLTVIVQHSSSPIHREVPVIRDVVSRAIGSFWNVQALRQCIKDFASVCKNSRFLSHVVIAALEREIDKGLKKLAEEANQRRVGELKSSSRSKDRHTTSDDFRDDHDNVQSALGILSFFCEKNSDYFDTLVPSLLSFSKVIAKAHLLDASARQRHGASLTRASSTGLRHHTPTAGILEYSFTPQNKTESSVKAEKRETQSSLISLLILIFKIFETKPIHYIFSKSRKELLQIITGVLDSSDDVKLIISAIHLMGKFLVNCVKYAPLTAKEQQGLLLRLATLDFCNVVDDASLQLVATTVFDLFQQISSTGLVSSSDDMFEKLITTCVLSSNLELRTKAQALYFATKHESKDKRIFGRLWRVLLSDYEGIGGRFWLVLVLDALITELDGVDEELANSYKVLAHGNAHESLAISKCLMRSAWKTIFSDQEKIHLLAAIEVALSRTYHFQFIREGSHQARDRSSSNVVRAFLALVLALDPMPLLNTNLITSLAENYNCWHEALQYFESVYEITSDPERKNTVASAVMHCYRHLDETDLWKSWAKLRCVLPKTKNGLSYDTYGLVTKASAEFASLMESTEERESDEPIPTDFEMDLWEEKWLQLQREMCQFQVVTEFANLSQEPMLQLECSWKNQDWDKVRSLTSSATLFSAVESGNPTLKMSETVLAVADGRLSDVENLHAQTAQLCLYRWQLLPLLATNSSSHSSLLHFFHRLVEIRESGQIMVETKKHASKRSLPDLKNLLNAWRHRLPNDWEGLSRWDEIFAWRSHMFSAITSNFHWCEPEKLATIHDRPWTSVRMAKTARKQRLRETSLLLLSQSTAGDERAINIPDAFLKLREQILIYNNSESTLERHGGLNLINLSSLSYFDDAQKSELFRLKAVFLQSLQRRSKANQAFSNAVQICPAHARAWVSWGEWYMSLGSAVEKQHVEQNPSTGANEQLVNDAAKKVRQYLSQAIGCFLEANQIDSNEWARMHLPGCLWMLSKDGANGSLCQTFERKATKIPSWMWLPWIPQLLTSLYRRECTAAKSILMRLARDYPQAVYYPLRVFYLERRDIDRTRSSSSSTSQMTQASVVHAEELVTALRRSHACLWSYLEPVLEELIVKFRPSNEEDLLSTIVALIDRSELQFGRPGKVEQEKDVLMSIWKTLGKIAAKYFKPSDAVQVQGGTKKDGRALKSAAFKDRYKAQFESDFCLAQLFDGSKDAEPPMDLPRMVNRLRAWQEKLEQNLSTLSTKLSLSSESVPLAMFAVGDAPDLWPLSCDPYISEFAAQKPDPLFDLHPTSQSTTSSSAAAALKAANSAASSVASAARAEGIGGSYGGGSSFIEVPGQYVPNTSQTDARPSPELHVKVLRFGPHVDVDTKHDVNVRRTISMEGSDGKTYRFHLGIAFSHLTRTDERTAQTHFLLDKILRKNNLSARAEISVQSQPVIPVAQRLRLVSEPEGRFSLAETFNKRSVVNAANLQHKFLDDVRTRLTSYDKEEDLDDATKRERAKRLEVFRNIRNSSVVDRTWLRRFVTDLCDSPEYLFQFQRVFSQQWAVNCLLQYTHSASDRSPSRVVIDGSTGRVSAPEFRIAYNHQGCFETIHVPFRLTSNLSYFLGPAMLEGKFVKALAVAADAAHSCRHKTDSIYRLLIRDDLVSYITKGSAKPDSKTVDIEKQLMPSVSRNVATLHARFAECSPSYQLEKTSKSQDVMDEPVRELLRLAELEEQQCLMPTSFQGWI